VDVPPNLGLLAVAALSKKVMGSNPAKTTGEF
jgi:hypothetical protein